MTKLKVLVFVGYYLPGYKAGGPLRTIANMVAHLKDDIEFWIVTRDRDLGDSVAYPGVQVNQWQATQGAHVYYISPEHCTVRQIGVIISETNHDVLYLNSFYDPVFTVKPLLARRFFSVGTKPCVVAPRGEFSVGAIALKATRKRVYNALSGFFGLYKDVVFQASSKHEVQDIIAVLGVERGCIEVAIDLPEIRLPVCDSSVLASEVFVSDVLKVIFLSRISPKKNLDFAIRALSLTSKKIQFDIYGPTEDLIYWGECQSLFAKLPSSVLVNYCGSVMPSEVQKVFSQYDLFFFPTRGENYGHVIAESLSVGTPVLLSDQTPWRDLEPQGLGWDISLVSPKVFAEKIDQFASLEFDVRLLQRSVVQAQAIKLLQSPENVEENLNLFRARLQS